jgi:UDP-N-acetylmuramoyl-L-alanyl-D-glutamate--2,6-diaminopimelate ligase
MLLRELAAHARARPIGDADVAISSIEYDSRAVRPGALFVAVRGLTVDGHAFIPQALANGAAALAVEEGTESSWREAAGAAGVPVVVMDDTRPGLAHLAAAFHGHPARRLKVVGVTGTDGKTSLANLLAHLFETAGLRAGLISTAECRIGDATLLDTGRFTTPEAPQVQEMLARMVAAGCDWAVIETTSHGLAMHRVDACEYDVAVLTNIGEDHLDFHGDAEAYREAKGRLFRMLDESYDKGIAKTAVLNGDDVASAWFASLSSARTVTYGSTEGSDVLATDSRPEGWTSCFRLRTPAGEREVRSPKPGRFNVSNAAAAAGVGVAAGIGFDTIVAAIESWPGAPGRMERIDEGQPFTVVVDFAHAPDSLRRVLELMRETAPGRVVALFGCIGEHDKARRPGMARAAADLADFTVVTDDNPYSEDGQAILDDIRRGMLAAGKLEGPDFVVIADRREAIPAALGRAAAGDAVLLAGKGHEREVHVGPDAYPCDDREVSRAVLRQLGYRR